MRDYDDAGDINVLTNKPGRVFLEFGEKSRAFDNVWQHDGIFIFKSWCLVLLFFSSSLLISLQASVEGSSVNVYSEHSFKTNPVGITWGLDLLKIRLDQPLVC